MLAAGHCAPTCYALWMIMGEALARGSIEATGDRRYYVAPDVAMLSVDALGFRRGAGALKTLLEDNGLADHPLFAQAKGRGIRALSGHIESTDVTNDVNGGPSGVGIATAAGKAAFWDIVGAPIGSPKIVAFEGEFAMCAGHAQELKTQAIALQAGKRLRIFFSDNNAGIDDALIGGVVHSKFEGYRLRDQWTSYGWNVFDVADGHDYGQILERPEDDGGLGPRRSPADDRHRQDDEGLLAGAGRKDSRRRTDRRLPEPSVRLQDELRLHRRAREDVRGALRREVRGHARRRRSPTRASGCSSSRRTSTSRCPCSTRTASATGWRTGSSRSATRSSDKIPLRIDVTRDPFLDDRLRVANLPEEPQKRHGQERRLRHEKDGQDRAVQEDRAKRPARGARSPRSSSG